MPDPIENIANLIIEEAANRDGNNLIRAIYNVNLSVRMRVLEMISEIKVAEIAERLKREIVGDGKC